MGQTTVNRRLGPRMLMVVAVGCRRRGSHTVHTVDKCVSNAKKKKNKKEKRRNIPGTRDTVASRVPFAPEMVVVAFGRMVVVVVVLL